MRQSDSGKIPDLWAYLDSKSRFCILCYAYKSLAYFKIYMTTIGEKREVDFDIISVIIFLKSLIPYHAFVCELWILKNGLEGEHT